MYLQGGLGGVHDSAGALGVRKRVLDPLELALCICGSSSMGAGNGASTPILQAISPVLPIFIFQKGSFIAMLAKGDCELLPLPAK